MYKYLVEFLGTFFFLAVILSVYKMKNIILVGLAIGLGLSCAIFIGGKVSGGHFNPAVTIMMYANNNLNLRDTIFYIISQILGGLAILTVFNLIN